MIKHMLKKLKSEKANTFVENVIILPLIFIMIYAMIIMSFVLHDRSTLEAAAKRGAIYAAHCISDPNYAKILSNSGNSKGSLDIDDAVTAFSFTEIGKNIQPYRYISGSSSNIKNQVKSEVKAIIDNTRIPWREITIDDIDYDSENKIFYQAVTVKISADYPIPKFFEAFGLDTNYKYTVSAKMAVNDPDEFIRNADLVVDLITIVDNATGNHISNAKEKILGIASKITDWIDIDK